MRDKPNLNYIKEISGGDKVFEEKFIGILKKEFPQERQTYESHILSNDMIAGAEIVHKLKHKFNILGMENAYHLAVAYEDELRTKNNKTHSEFVSILEQITTFIKTI